VKLGVPYNPNFSYKQSKKVPDFDKIKKDNQVKPTPEYQEPFENLDLGELSF
jgi:hypothetical protein